MTSPVLHRDPLAALPLHRHRVPPGAGCMTIVGMPATRWPCSYPGYSVVGSARVLVVRGRWTALRSPKSGDATQDGDRRRVSPTLHNSRSATSATGELRLGRGLVGLWCLWDLVRERQHPAVGRRRQTHGVKAEAALLEQPDAGGHNLGIAAETGTGGGALATFTPCSLDTSDRVLGVHGAQ